jgi:hydrogenase/urease accessory protein HupE
MMSQSTILYIAALVAALLSIGPQRTRILAIIAAVVAGIALTLSLGILSISLPHVDLAVFGALVVLGVMIVLRINEKMKVIAGTVIASVGALGLMHVLLG